MLPVKTTLLPTVSRFLDDDWNILYDWSEVNSKRDQQNYPLTNIFEFPDHYRIEMSMPGVRKDSFSIEYIQGRLSVKSIDENEESLTVGSIIKKEFDYYKFNRSFDLNESVIKPESIKAKYENGILSIHISKKEEVIPKPPQLIKVS